MKLVSVIVPVYQKEQYITATINSVLRQTYNNWELIIVDDGSTDRSLDICQHFSDPRIKIISQANGGVSSALNTGIRAAQGDYIAFLDGDDLWQSENLAKQIAHLENSPQLGVSFSRSALIDSTGRSLGTHLMPKLTGIDVVAILRCYPMGNGSSGVLRREAVMAVEFNCNGKKCYYDEALSCSQDIEFLLRIALLTDWEIAGIPDALTLYRVHSQGLSSNFEKKLAVWARIMAKMHSYAAKTASRWESLSWAYQYRDLARKAVRIRDGKTAVNLCQRALTTYSKIILEEPRRTIFTLVAAYGLWLFPSPFYNLVEDLALKIAESRQKRRILQDQYLN